MKDVEKTRGQLVAELVQMRQRIAESGQVAADGKREKQATDEAREYADSIVATVREPLLVLDADLRIISANRSFYQTFGVTPEETQGNFIYDLGNRQWDIPRLRELLEEILPKDTFFNDFVMEHNFPTIGRKIMVLNARRLYNENKKTRLVLLAIQDITENKRAEEKLSASELRYRRLFETAQDGILILNADTGQIVDVNPFLINMLGYSREEFLGRKLWDIGTFIDIEASKKAFRELQRKRFIRHENLPLATKDLKQIWVEFVSNVYQIDGEKVIQCNIRDITDRKRAEEKLRDYKGQLEKKVAQRTAELQKANRKLQQDITKRKQAENTLRESEEKFFRIFRSSPNPVSLATLGEGRFLDVNESWLQFFGYSRDEVIGHRSAELCTWAEPGDRAKLIKDLQEEGKVRAHERKFRTKSGEIRTALLSVEVVPIGNEPCIISNLQDITERKHAEQSLRESEEKFSKAFNTSPDMMSITTFEDGRYVEVNDSWTRTTRYSRAEAIGHSGLELGLWVKPGQRQQLVQVLRAKGKVNNEEVEFTRKSGEQGIGLYSADALHIGGQDYILGITKDITERKKAQEVLRQSEEKFSKAFHSSPDMMSISTLKEGRYLDVNDSWVSVTGYPREEAIGRTSLEMGIWANPDARESYLRTLQEKGKVNNLEVAVVSKSGEIRTCLLSAETVQVGGETCKLASAKDVSEIKRVEQALQQSEQNFHNSLDTSPLGIRIVTEDGELLYANKAILDIYGYSSIEELKATSVQQRFTSLSYTQFLQRKEKRQRGERFPSTYEIEIVRRDGEVRTLQVSRAVTLWNGEEQFQVTYRDITEHKRMQERLILADRLASLGQLASGIAHELNNPLTGVIGFSELLLGKDLPEDIKEDLATINSEAKRTANVVKGLLTFARKQGTEKEPVDINSIIQGVLQLRSYEQKVSNIEVDARFAPDLPQVLGNQGQLQQVFVNLIINAEQAMLEAHNKGKLTITTEQIENAVRTSITDDGPGISPENMRKLFTPFFTTKEVGKGTGLGLSICHGIVTEHGGKIYATDSKPGYGATFIVELPVNK